MCSKLEGIFKHIGLTAMTQLSMEWHGQEDVEPLQDAKDTYWQKLKTLHFHFSDPTSH